MAYYENRKELLDGDLILYQRNLRTAVPSAKGGVTRGLEIRLEFGL
jgi:hypothetical protein